MCYFSRSNRNNQTNMNKELQNKLADKEVNQAILLATGCGAIPAPIIDMGATIFVQMRMMRNLCDIYEVKWDEHIGKSFIGSIVGTLGKRAGASMLKSIPIAGSIVGGFANAILSGASTYAMGNAFIKYMQMNSAVKSLGDIDKKVFGGLYEDMSKQTGSIMNMIRQKLFGQKMEEKTQSQSSINLSALGKQTFGDDAKFFEWLRTPNQMMENKLPIELMLSSDEKDHVKLKRLIEIHAETAAKP